MTYSIGEHAHYSKRYEADMNCSVGAQLEKQQTQQQQNQQQSKDHLTIIWRGQIEVPGPVSLTSFCGSLTQSVFLVCNISRL